MEMEQSLQTSFPQEEDILLDVRELMYRNKQKVFVPLAKEVSSLTLSSIDATLFRDTWAQFSTVTFCDNVRFQKTAYTRD